MKITVPELSLVLLVGPSGCGKSTFARQHFKPTEVLSSDYCRGLVSDDENDQTSTKEAFEVLHFIARKRLAAGRLTVIDATNVQPDSRKPLVALTREFHILPVAIVFDFPEKVCQERNRTRPNRDFGPHVVRNQAQQLRRLWYAEIQSEWHGRRRSRVFRSIRSFTMDRFDWRFLILALQVFGTIRSACFDSELLFSRDSLSFQSYSATCSDS